MKQVGLREDELERIAEGLGRRPSPVELYAFDAQWSEHCSYKSSRRHLRRLPSAGARVVLGPGEDAGIVHLGTHAGERYGIVVAHESHNHPSQVVPFEGAATGVGGVVRDVLCMGAEVVGLADPLRFGLTDDVRGHQAYVARSAVDGIGAYGNAIGVPNVAGDVYFERGFNDNCLVNVIALGIVKEDEVVRSYVPKEADCWDLVLVGKATDPSGFGGASFSSLTLDARDAQLNKSAVQVPDPFLENVLMRATYRVFALLRGLKIAAAFKDLGAGGIMGCSAEITGQGGCGADIDLDCVNVALPAMAPEVIAVGETQERLLWAVPPEISPELLRIYNEVFTLPEIACNARATVIGRVTSSERYILRHRGEVVMDVPSLLLTAHIDDELPYMEVIYHGGTTDELPAVDVESIFPKVLAHRDVCSREPLYRRYDSVVRGSTVLPRGSGDAGVLAPVTGSRLGVALAVAGNPRYGRLDPKYAAQHAVLEAMRRVVAVGAVPIGLTDCLNFGNPRKPEQYGAFIAAVDGLAHAATELDLPFVSGNVSFYNEGPDGAPIPASAIVACVGALDDVAAVVTPGLKGAGSSLLWVGSRELVVGGSVLADVLGIEGQLPALSMSAERAAVAIVHDAVTRGVLRACRAVADGGMLTALARLAFDAMLAGRSIGAEIDFGNPLCEAGGFLCEVSDDSEIDVTGVLRVGQTIDEPQLIVNGVRFDVARLYEIWSRPLAELYP
ncbi:MAG: phosphoribosylformylglycinamidine synthase subunit PurL [Candidatus Eremiobacteraeota bacterium]|nr:phosphoribosylformylglycinamidine synthase subunit PurL [Candidatus Eremiobacteraeota bacterium]